MNTQTLVALFLWFVGTVTISQHIEKRSSLTPHLNVAQEVPPSFDHRGSGRIYTDDVTIVL